MSDLFLGQKEAAVPARLIILGGILLLIGRDEHIDDQGFPSADDDV